MARLATFSPMLRASFVLLSLLAMRPAALAVDTNFFPSCRGIRRRTSRACSTKFESAVSPWQALCRLAMLDECKKEGLKAIVSDNRSGGYDWAGTVDAAKARQNVSNLVAEVNTHPAVYGYYLRDEPSAAWFNNLEKVAGPIRELAPGKWPYINLFPDYAENWQLGTTGYVDYLEKFIEICHPQILSYDNYSIMDDGSVRGAYWTNLEAVRAAAVKHKLVFWNIVLSVAHFNYREPSAADLRFEAYTGLAYGARGLAWFTYFAPPVGGYRGAPVDQFGHKTATWQHMQNVNLQVQKLGPTLNHLHSDDVYHFGKAPSGAKSAPTNSLVSAVGGDNYLVGELTTTMAPVTS